MESESELYWSGESRLRLGSEPYDAQAKERRFVERKQRSRLNYRRKKNTHFLQIKGQVMRSRTVKSVVGSLFASLDELYAN